MTNSPVPLELTQLVLTHHGRTRQELSRLHERIRDAVTVAPTSGESSSSLEEWTLIVDALMQSLELAPVNEVQLFTFVSQVAYLRRLLSSSRETSELLRQVAAVTAWVEPCILPFEDLSRGVAKAPSSRPKALPFGRVDVELFLGNSEDLTSQTENISALEKALAAKEDKLASAEATIAGLRLSCVRRRTAIAATILGFLIGAAAAGGGIAWICC